MATYYDDFRGCQTIDDLKLKLNRFFESFFTELDSLNISTLNTNMTKISSGDGTTILNGSTIDMYDNSYIKRLSFGNDGTDYRFSMKNKSGVETLGIDSTTGNIKVTGNITMTGGTISWSNVNSDPVATNAASTATSALSITQQIANGTYTGGTFISNNTIYSPNIYGATINGGTINVTTDINVGNVINLGSMAAKSKTINMFNNSGSICYIDYSSTGFLSIYNSTGAKLDGGLDGVFIYGGDDIYIDSIGGGLNLSASTSIDLSSSTNSFTMNGSNIASQPWVTSWVASQGYVNIGTSSLTNYYTKSTSDSRYCEAGTGGGYVIDYINASPTGISVHCVGGYVLNFIKD